MPLEAFEREGGKDFLLGHISLGRVKVPSPYIVMKLTLAYEEAWL